MRPSTFGPGDLVYWRMAERAQIGLPDDVTTRPLLGRLRGMEEFEVALDAPASVALRLERRTLAGALLSPIDYARNASEYLIIPGCAVSSPSGNESIVLHFR